MQTIAFVIYRISMHFYRLRWFCEIVKEPILAEVKECKNTEEAEAWRTGQGKQNFKISV